MANVSSAVYGSALPTLAGRAVNLSSGSLAVLLLTAAYTPDFGAHRYVSDLRGEAAGTGYTTGGKALTGLGSRYDKTSRTVTVTCDDVTWPASTLTARYAVFYDAAPASPSSQSLLVCWDFGADVHSLSGPFTLTLAATGLLTMQAV